MPKVSNNPTPGASGPGVLRSNAPTGVAHPLPLNDRLRQKTWQNARQVIKDEFKSDPKPGGMRHAFLANIAMLLYDHYGLDITDANKAADDIIKLVFEDTYY